MKEAIIGREATTGEAGFSLLELVIAMTITLLMMTAASTLLTSSVGTRVRENSRTDALADAQRAIQIMSREIANSGFGLTNNGIVPTDATATPESAICIVRASFAAVFPEGSAWYGRFNRFAASSSSFSTIGLVFGPVETVGPARSLHETYCCGGRS